MPAAPTTEHRGKVAENVIQTVLLGHGDHAPLRQVTAIRLATVMLLSRGDPVRNRPVLKLLEQHDGSFSIFGPDKDPLRSGVLPAGQVHRNPRAMKSPCGVPRGRGMTLPASTHSSGFRCTAGGELLW